MTEETEYFLDTFESDGRKTDKDYFAAGRDAETVRLYADNSVGMDEILGIFNASREYQSRNHGVGDSSDRVLVADIWQTGRGDVYEEVVQDTSIDEFYSVHVGRTLQALENPNVHKVLEPERRGEADERQRNWGNMIKDAAAASVQNNRENELWFVTDAPSFEEEFSGMEQASPRQYLGYAHDQVTSIGGNFVIVDYEDSENAIRSVKGYREEPFEEWQ